MNKQAGGAVAGPTAAAAAAAAQKQKSLLQRSDNEINSILENFTLLIKAARVQAADSLLKLVSELKQTAVFSDFASLNKHVENNNVKKQTSFLQQWVKRLQQV